VLPVQNSLTHSSENELTVIENAVQDKPCHTSDVEIRSPSDQIGKYFVLFSLNI